MTTEKDGLIEHVVNLTGEQYVVTFTRQEDEDAEMHRVTFITTTEKDTKEVIAALSAFSSGDIQTCHINGEEAVLHLDWGLK